jgi:hypothetical protein
MTDRPTLDACLSRPLRSRQTLAGLAWIINLKVAQLGATVTITEASLTADSPTVATVVDRQFVENQPLNGRSFQTLVELSPGVVMTPSDLYTPGQFSVNGQRCDENDPARVRANRSRHPAQENHDRR